MKVNLISRAFLVVALGLFIGMGFQGFALAAEEEHAEEALKHAKEAVTHGNAGHGDILLQHAQEALKHAEAAQKAAPNAHLAEGIKALKEVAEHQKAGHLDVATKSAETAVTHLSQVKAEEEDDMDMGMGHQM